VLVLKFALVFTGALVAIVKAAPTVASHHEVTIGTLGERSPALECGQFQTIEGVGPLSAFANGHNRIVDELDHLMFFDNWSCGIFLVFRQVSIHSPSQK
jgi:hypothetical protein